MINVVELIADESAFDQPCKFGNRVDGHAVYCHNDAWGDSPRKCRRSWYTGGEVKDEDCPGYQPNLEYKGAIHPTEPAKPLCSKCGGVKILPTERDKTETCRHCMGDGSEPSAVNLSTYEQDSLEMGLAFSGSHPAQYDYYVRMVETKDERDSINKLIELDLVSLRSVSFAKEVSAYLIKLTGKGDAVMRANWEEKKRATSPDSAKPAEG